MRYSAFRTGLTFAEVKASMKVASDNPEDWVYRRRNGVLGRWRQIKLGMWDAHKRVCEPPAAPEDPANRNGWLDFI